MVRHLSCGELVWGKAQKWREKRPQIRISESVGQKPEHDDRVEQRWHPCVGEAQSDHALSSDLAWLIDLLKGVGWLGSRSAAGRADL
jgi:hypothetical protein